MIKTIEQQIIDRLDKLREEISANIDRLGLKASGRTQASMRVTHEGDEFALWGRRFFSALQYGSRPWSGVTGIRCSFFEFQQIIWQWMRDKGIWAKDPEKASGNIARSIIRGGTKLYRSGGKLDVYDTLIEKAINDIENIPMTLLSTEIDNVIAQWAR